jgi:hypothetical protein
VGPSAGHIYAGEGVHAAVTTGLRVAGVGVVVVGEACFLGGALLAAGGKGEGCPSADTAIGVGMAVVLGVALYDVIDAHGAVDRRLARRRADAGLTLVPAIGDHQVGLTLAGAL